MITAETGALFQSIYNYNSCNKHRKIYIMLSNNQSVVRDYPLNTAACVSETTVLFTRFPVSDTLLNRCRATITRDIGSSTKEIPRLSLNALLRRTLWFFSALSLQKLPICRYIVKKRTKI